MDASSSDRGGSRRRVRVRVEGLVQGVYFRASTADRANALGVGGWIRNSVDGAVELEAEGAAEPVDALIAWCRRGPPAARVTAVTVEELAPSGEAGRFRVRH